MVGRHARSLAIALLVLAGATVGCGGPASTGGASAPAGPMGSGAIPAGHPLVGTWVTEVTRGDLAAGGIAEPGLQNENAGRFTWTFAPDGTWTSIQQSLDGAPVNSPVFRGTYTLEGDTLVATTAFPAQYADTGLHYTWSVDGDEARFDVLDPPDPIMPVVVETHPWRRGG